MLDVYAKIKVFIIEYGRNIKKCLRNIVRIKIHLFKNS